MPEYQEDIETKASSAVELVSKAVIKAGLQMGLTGAHLAGVLGLSAATVSRMRSGKHLLTYNSKPYELAVLLLRIHHGLLSITKGDSQKMRVWMKTANAQIGDVPAHKILRVQGLISVLGCVELRVAAAA